MRRRPEPYHDAIRTLAAAPSADDDATAAAEPASIHDTLRSKEDGLAAHLVYDDHERRSGLVRALATGTPPADWAMARAIELGDALDGSHELVDLGLDRLTTRREADIAGAAVTVTKTYRLGGDRRSPTLETQLVLEHRGGPALDTRLGLEWATTMLGGGGNPAAWWEVDGTRSGHDTTGQAGGVRHIAQGNDFVGISVLTTMDTPTDVWWAPIDTVSNSEDGFERVYQGSAWLLSWPVRLTAGERWERVVRQTVTTTRDRSAEES
jgi:alpha-amylase